MADEPTITCPKCGAEIKLTESLAAPLIDSLRQQHEAEIAKKDIDVAQREAAIREQQAALVKDREQIDEQVAAKIKAERPTIAAAAEKKAREALSDELAKTLEEKETAEALLKDRDAKLAEARKNELELRKERQQFQEEKEQFELEKQRAIDSERAKIREQARKDADDEHRLKIAEKEKQIGDLQKSIEAWKRKAEQGSQQLQGEVQELDLEQLLADKFPFDTIEPVAKGVRGADVLQRVRDATAQECGSILWESKRAKNWNESWLVKLRSDQRDANADIAIIVSETLPEGLTTFEYRDGVIIVARQCIVPIGTLVRHRVIEVSSARQVGEGQKTKMELLYEYLTGPQFRHRVEAIVEAFTTMTDDLESEKRAVQRQWAKRAKQIDIVTQSTVGMWGDLQGIAGKTLQEIEGLDMPLLEMDRTDSESTVK